MTRRLVPVFLLVGALAVAVPASAIDFNVTAGLDFSGSFDSDQLDYGSSTGFNLGLEVAFDLTGSIEVGAGFMYGFPRGSSSDGISDLDYNYLHGLLRWHPLGLPVYVAVLGGYADVSGDQVLEGNLDGGLTWGAGAGFEFLEKFKVELLFNSFDVDVSVSDLDANTSYDSWSARFVYTF
jgi:hypothetical protein